MKKYITITSLLVAGTAFASAAEWSVTNSTTTTVSNFWATGITFCLSDTSRLTVTGEDTIPLEVQLSTITTNIRGLVDKGTGTPGTDALSLVLCDAEMSIIALSTNTVSSTGNVTWNFGEDAIFKTSEKTYLFYIDSDYSDTAAGAVGKKITEVDSNTEWLVRAGASTLINYGSTGTTNSLWFAGNAYGPSYTTNPGDSSTQYAPKISMTLTTPVPEPSAFGLLAGIGALALVASRRRRK